MIGNHDQTGFVVDDEQVRTFNQGRGNQVRCLHNESFVSRTSAEHRGALTMPSLEYRRDSQWTSPWRADLDEA